MLLQQYYAEKACREINLLNPKIKIHHRSGRTIINCSEYGIVFPKSLIEYCKNLWGNRIHNFYFKGNIGKNREWIRSYSNVYKSDRGRNKDLKYTLDHEYYRNLGNTKFALAPVGNCPWSYRFFESVACGAIPVLGDGDIDIFSKDYKFFRHSDEKIYRIDDAISNYNVLLNKVII